MISEEANNLVQGCAYMSYSSSWWDGGITGDVVINQTDVIGIIETAEDEVLDKFKKLLIEDGIISDEEVIDKLIEKLRKQDEK